MYCSVVQGDIAGVSSLFTLYAYEQWNCMTAAFVLKRRRKGLRNKRFPLRVQNV